MGKAKKKYIPPKKHNPVVLQRKLEDLRLELGRQAKNIDTISKSYDVHITMLSNYARHDIKNSVQSIDTILSTNQLEELTGEHLNSLKLNVKIIRETLDNFTKLVPFSKEGKFEFQDLMHAIELINRETFYINKIQFIKEIPEGNFTLNLSFQSVLQMINNIIINAVKAFENVIEQKRLKFVVTYDTEHFYLKIYDNASKIIYSDINSIFEYGVSSSGGSGIGLHHAKYLCNLYEGDIQIFELENDENFTKYFLINLPLIDSN
jgi:signal transduction histidine kinase